MRLIRTLQSQTPDIRSASSSRARLLFPGRSFSHCPASRRVSQRRLPVDLCGLKFLTRRILDRIAGSRIGHKGRVPTTGDLGGNQPSETRGGGTYDFRWRREATSSRWNLSVSRSETYRHHNGKLFVRPSPARATLIRYWTVTPGVCFIGHEIQRVAAHRGNRDAANTHRFRNSRSDRVP